MKSIHHLLFCFFFLLYTGTCAQDADQIFKVSKPKTTSAILPDVNKLTWGMTYHFTIPNVKTKQIRNTNVSFGTYLLDQDKNGRDMDLTVTVTETFESKGEITLYTDGGAILATKEYRIVTPLRNITTTISGNVIKNTVVLLLNKDTLVNNGTISLKQLQNANYLTLVDHNLLNQTFVRKNLMCKISIIRDTVVTVMHSSLDRLSDKVKQKLLEVKAGDVLLIDKMENLWIDGKRDDHIESYGDLVYEINVTD